MPDSKPDWTNDLAKQWDLTWQLQHMQAGLLELQRRCKVTPIPLASGHDALVMASAEHHRKVGQQEMLNAVEEMRKEHVERKPLPPEFTAASRGEKPK